MKRTLYQKNELSSASGMSVPRHFSYNQIIRAFKELGFVPDVESQWVTVLREINFPFKRVVLPRENQISIELLSFLLKDINIPLHKFLKLLQ